MRIYSSKAAEPPIPQPGPSTGGAVPEYQPLSLEQCRARKEWLRQKYRELFGEETPPPPEWRLQPLDLSQITCTRPPLHTLLKGDPRRQRPLHRGLQEPGQWPKRADASTQTDEFYWGTESPEPGPVETRYGPIRVTCTLPHITYAERKR